MLVHQNHGQNLMKPGKIITSTILPVQIISGTCITHTQVLQAV